jgi:hypothetical protein
VQNVSSRIRNILNKMYICMELNKEQLSLFEFFKIQNWIWIKIQRTYLN